MTQSVAEVVANAPLNKYHILIAALCCTLMAMDGYDLIAFGTVVIHLMADWKLPPVQAGALGSAALIGMLIGSVFIAPLSDKYGRRPLTLICVAGASIANFACGFATDPTQFGALRFVVGLFLGALIPNFIALLGELVPKASRPQILTAVGACFSVGALVAVMLAIYVEPLWTWRGVFYIAGLPVIFLLPILLKVLPESPAFLALRGRTEELKRLMAKIAPNTPYQLGTAHVPGSRSNRNCPSG